jgi:hypothetical protein
MIELQALGSARHRCRSVSEWFRGVLLCSDHPLVVLRHELSPPSTAAPPAPTTATCPQPALRLRLRRGADHDQDRARALADPTRARRDGGHPRRLGRTREGAEATIASRTTLALTRHEPASQPWQSGAELKLAAAVRKSSCSAPCIHAQESVLAACLQRGDATLAAQPGWRAIRRRELLGVDERRLDLRVIHQPLQAHPTRSDSRRNSCATAGLSAIRSRRCSRA